MPLGTNGKTAASDVELHAPRWTKYPACFSGAPLLVDTFLFLFYELSIECRNRLHDTTYYSILMVYYFLLRDEIGSKRPEADANTEKVSHPVSGIPGPFGYHRPRDNFVRCSFVKADK